VAGGAADPWSGSSGRSGSIGPKSRGKRRHPGDPDSRPAVLPAAPPPDSGLIRLNLPDSAAVLPVCHDDAGWYVACTTCEHSPASLVLT
jgi:hypothetical protein